MAPRRDDALKAGESPTPRNRGVGDKLTALSGMGEGGASGRFLQVRPRCYSVRVDTAYFDPDLTVRISRKFSSIRDVRCAIASYDNDGTICLVTHAKARAWPAVERLEHRARAYLQRVDRQIRFVHKDA
jgi:hypothetical protein